MENPLKIALEGLRISAEDWAAVSAMPNYDVFFAPYVDALEDGATFVAERLGVDFYTALVMIVQTVLERQELEGED